MKPIVYIETSVISYLTAWPSRDIVVAAQQQLTREWWETTREHYAPIISQVVLREIAQGDPAAAKLRMESVHEVEVVEITDDVTQLAQTLLTNGAVPINAADDALHIAIATVNGAEYLLTWNCRHIANASVRAKIEEACRLKSYRMPVICSPQELLWSEDDGP